MTPGLSREIAREQQADLLVEAEAQRIARRGRRARLRTGIGLALVSAGGRLASTEREEIAVIVLPRSA